MKSKKKITLRASSIIYACLVYIFLYLPIIIIILFSFNSGKSTSSFAGFTLDGYVKMFQNEQLLESFTNTIIVAISSTFLSTVIGTIAAVGMYRYNFKGKGIIDSLLYIPIVIPEVVMAISLVMLFNMFNITLGMLTVIMAHVTFCLPFVIITVRSRMAGFDKHVEEAAMDLGANRVKTFMTITIPIIAPGILAGAMLSLSLSLDDVIISSFTAGTTSMFPNFVYGQLRRSFVGSDIHALSTLIIIGTLLIMILSNYFERRADKKLLGEEITEVDK